MATNPGALIVSTQIALMSQESLICLELQSKSGFSYTEIPFPILMGKFDNYREYIKNNLTID